MLALPPAVEVRFDRGTLVVHGDAATAATLPGAVWDGRAEVHRAPAHRYEDIVTALEERGFAVAHDLRRGWRGEGRDLGTFDLRPYQADARMAWEAAARRGVVVMPTGAGKTRLALAAIASTGLSTLVLCPTRALLVEWQRALRHWFAEPIGVVGDGSCEVARLTVMTFESAYRRLDELGDRFGLLVVDEVHHFGSGQRREALEASAASARLGLTATPPARDSEAAANLADLVGPVVFQVGVADLVGRHLARLARVRIPVRLTPDEAMRYERAITRFRGLCRAYFRSAEGAGYSDLARHLGATREGRQALRDHVEARGLACFPEAKMDATLRLLRRHRGDRTIVFTARADDAYRIGARGLVPVITAEVSARERNAILDKFRAGRLRAIVSARVLNEGIDVPEANVAIVVGGSLGAREHVQRIGRILRPSPGKVAIAYELVTLGTLDERLAFVRRLSGPTEG